MSDRIETTFARLKGEGQAALIPYIAAGDPDLATTRSAIRTLAEAGADMIELGIPFTDPIADGPTIQQSCERALRHPFSLADILNLVRDIRADGVEIPIILMSYANPIFAAGFENFASQAAASGVDGVLVTDIPPEEAEDYAASMNAHGLKTVFLCSPTTSIERLQMIGRASTGYVYYVAHAGVTGIRDSLPPDIADTLKKLKSSLSKPLCVGFGISTPQQARALSPHADGLIVGSAIVRHFEDKQGDSLQESLHSFTQSLKKAMQL